MKILLAPANVLLRLIEEGVRPLSLRLRLFGNLYAGELILVLIALMTANSSLAHFSTYLMGALQFLSGFAWTAFHTRSEPHRGGKGVGITFRFRWSTKK